MKWQTQSSVSPQLLSQSALGASARGYFWEYRCVSVLWHGESLIVLLSCAETHPTPPDRIFFRLELLLWCLLTPPSTAEQFHHWGGIVSAAG